MSRLPTSQAIEMMTEATSTARIGPSRRKSAADPFVRPASALTARGLADPEGGHEEEHGENEGRNRAPDVDGRVGESLDHVARDDGGRKVRARGRERERREGEAAVFRRRDVAREALDHDVREHEG